MDQKAQLFQEALGKLKDGQYDEASKLFMQAAELGGTAGQTAQKVQEAESLLGAGELEGATALFLEALEENPTTIRAHLGLARIALYLGRVEEAEVYTTAATKLQPERGETWTITGLVREAKGDVRGALRNLKKGAELSPQSFLAQFNFGRVLAAVKKHDEAFRHLTLATQIEPGSYDAWYALGITHKESGDMGQALIAFTKAMQAHPDNFDVYATLADVLVEARDLEMAREVLDEGLGRCGENPALLEKAIAVAMGQADMPATVAYLERQVAVLPQHQQAWINLANAYLLTTDLEKSEWAAKELLKIAPDNWEAHYHLGNLYEAMPLEDQAEAEYRKAVELAPGNHKPLANLGALLVERDDKSKNQEALGVLQQAIERAPEGEWRPRYNLALAHVRLGDKPKARQLCKQILEQAPPDNPAVELARVLDSNLAEQGTPAPA